MSKRIPAQITCPACKSHFDVELYRSIWVEYPENRRLVAEDKLNLVTCPHCHVSTRLEFPVLCTNVQRKIAIWYEPYPDPAVDEDMRQYAKHFGPNSFYAQAPRVRNWNDFKAQLTLLEAMSYKDQERPLPKSSEEMATAMSGFIKSLPKRRPSWLSHLRSPVLRAIYAALPMTAMILFAAWSNQNDLESWFYKYKGEMALYFSMVTGLLFGLLTAINALAVNGLSVITKSARIYLFLGTCWGVMSFLVLLLFDPLEYGSPGYMNDREIAQAIFIIGGIPLLSGIAFYSFNRFIR